MFGKLTYVRRFGSTLLYASMYTFLIIICSSTSAAAQGLACNNSVQVSLNLDCEAEITPGMILEGEDEDNLAGYTVDIEGVTGTVVTEIGVYKVTVSAPGGNSCWGYIYVEDKLAPIIDDCNCPEGNTDPDCEFLCTDLDGILAGTVSTPTPVVIENCSGLESDYADVVTDGAGCGQKIVTRQWIFTDGSGNEATGCVQQFVLNPIDLVDVVPPVDPVEVPCGTDISMPSLVSYFTPLVGQATAYTYAYPTINGEPLLGTTCNLVVTKSDLILPVCNQECSNSIKAIRSWTVLDWCLGTARDFSQVIKAVDQEPPTVVAEDITVSADPWQCVGNFFLPEPTILHDNCTDFVEYTVKGPAGVTITYNNANGLYMATGAPKGDNTFIYEAYDCCDNIATDEVTVTVIDNVAPVAVAKEFIVVSLTTQGQAKIFAASVDNGSHDGCSDVHIEIRRDRDNCDINGNTTYDNTGHPQDSPTDTDEGDFVKFCCEDATTLEVDVDGDGELDRGYVKVWLRVWDDGDMNGVFGSENDNYNEAWSFIKVDDKLPATIVCPPDAYINCDDDEDYLDLTGTAVASATCGDLDVDYTDSDNLNSCNVGVITRTWFVVSDPTVRCIQRIYKEADAPFTGVIDWPNDRTTNCIDLNDDGDEPTWSAPACAQVGYSLKSDTFTIEEDACLKILNRWTVVDWCQYDPNTSQYTGIWEHTQVIKVIDNEAPVLNCSNQMYAVDDNDDADNDGNLCERKNLMLTAIADDNGDCSSKWLKWTALVDLWGDGEYDYEYSTSLPFFDNSFNDTNGNGIPDRYLAPTSSGEEVAIRIPEDIPGSMANHKIKWVVSDGCGNITECSYTFMVTDKKAPTPYCIGISSALMENGMVELWACDFDLGSFDNCTEQGDLRFTFTDTPPQNDPAFDESQNCSAKAFTCDDIAEDSEISVDVYVWDEKGNSDFCTVVLNLIDNQGACGDGVGMSTVAGAIYDPMGGTAADIEVTLSASVPELSRTTQSLEDGTYAFSNLPMDLNYQVTASHDEDVRKGINTLDVVLIQRHILELEPFADPYQLIAADVTNDERVTAADLLALRKLILGVNSEFANTESYLFLNMQHQFENAANPWPLATSIDLHDMEATMSGKDMMMLKVGDVNRDGYSLTTNDEEMGFRTRATLGLTAAVTPGKTSLNTDHPASIAGMQLVLELNGATVTDVTSTVLDITDDMYTARGGKLYISWAGSDNVGLATGDELLTIHTNGEAQVTLAQNEMLHNEAYIGSQLAVVDMELKQRTATAEEYTFALQQNDPNPFKATTTVSYTVPTAQQVNIAVYDITGKQVANENMNAQQGDNTYTIDLGSAGAGIYYYTVKAGSHSATKKMIKVN